MGIREHKLLFHLDLSLFKLVDFLSNHLHFLELPCNCSRGQQNFSEHEQTQSLCFHMDMQTAHSCLSIASAAMATGIDRGAYADVRTRPCSLFGCRTPGATDRAARSGGYSERAPSHDERYTFWRRFSFQSCRLVVGEEEVADDELVKSCFFSRVGIRFRPKIITNRMAIDRKDGGRTKHLFA